MKIGIFCSIIGMAAYFASPSAMAAAKKSSTKGTSVIQGGTNVRTRVDVSGLYDQACYDAYYGCMDQFCIMENSNGGSCACSDDNEKYEAQLAEIKKTFDEADRISTVEVEKIEAGAKADIIFNGTRRYDENGNVMGVDEKTDEEIKAEKKASRRNVQFASVYDDDDDMDALEMIAGKKGNELFKLSEQICLDMVPESCEKDVQMLRQVYSRQITADCKAFANYVEEQQKEAQLAMVDADKAVRDALRQSFEDANEYDLGKCIVKFRECMTTDDACGENWENCVSTIASENMQNNKATSVADSTVEPIETYDITASTMERLNAKRDICENILDKCMAVRNQVWPKFLRDVAPTLKTAELNAESKMRQSCLTDISDCIQKACKDDIVGKGVDTMDACLSRPDMVRSFCKIEIDRCERMEPQIWGYVTDKLAAMRVDVCTQEVKDCIFDDNRCGANFTNCIGMDFDYIHQICPLEKLVVCKQTNPNFSMNDLDSMLMGLYLNIDNAALEQCQALVDEKMSEICGSTSDCNRFAADGDMGAGSLRSQKDGTTYRVTGMISFGSIKMGDAAGTVYDTVDGKQVQLKPGELGVQGYIEQIEDRNASVKNAEGIVATIEEELNNIAGTINRTIELIEQDPKIQFCVSGRNLDQIVGTDKDKKGRRNEPNMTEARFPNLLNEVKMQIAVAALRQAQDNYNAKLAQEIANATKDASADMAQYMCQRIAETGGASLGGATPTTPLAPPYSISYDVGAGLTNEDLTKGGIGNSSFKSDNGSGMTKETTAVFNRETRTCHVCSTVSTTSCKVKGRNWFRRKNTNCNVETKDPVCEDIPM